MATLSAGGGFGALARILHAAAALGPGAWDDPNAVPVRPAPEPTLSADLLALFSLLRDRGVAYLLVGGVAMLRYIEGRNTDDIDLLLSVQSLAKIPEVVIGGRNRDFARGAFRSLRVDLLLTANPLFNLVDEGYATTHRFYEMDVPCATAAGLALLTLDALPSLYRQGDLQRAALYEADLTMLYQKHRPAMDAVLEAVGPHVERGQFEELRRVVSEIEERVRRMGRSQGR